MGSERLAVSKTYKLFIGGKFPRSESGRTIPVGPDHTGAAAHVGWASRKDLRDAVAAARKAQEGWANATAYNRGQVLYRMAEMLEGKRAEFAAALASPPGSPNADAEITAAVDRLVRFGGWADKYAQVLGCNNPVAGPYYNFTTPEPTGVVAAVAPDEPPLLALVTLIAPPLCAGNAVVAVSGESPAALLSAAIFGEVLATSDVPAGVVNILTGRRDELIPFIAGHRDIDAVAAAGMSDDHARALREGAAENVKRVTVRDGVDWWNDDDSESPWSIEPFVEFKTVWHPSGA